MPERAAGLPGLVHAFRHGDNPALRILKCKFAHAVELGFEGHDNLGAGRIDRLQDLFNALAFEEERKRATERIAGERGIVLADRFLVVEENLDPSPVGDGCEDIGRAVGNGDSGLKSENRLVEANGGLDVVDDQVGRELGEFHEYLLCGRGGADGSRHTPGMCSQLLRPRPLRGGTQVGSLFGMALEKAGPARYARESSTARVRGP